MVFITHNEVYNALTFEWQDYREIYKNLTKQLGLDNLTVRQKLTYIIGFQSYRVKHVDMNQKIARLEEQGLAETKFEPAIVHGVNIKHYFARKKPCGKNEENWSFEAGNLDIGFQFG